MYSIDASKLNPSERKVLDTLSSHAKYKPAPTITEAASICGCSSSLVSKAVKKAGFSGYKQYIRYLYFGDIPHKESWDELERLKHVIDAFDMSLVDEFVDLMRSHKKIMLFGYGPSYICAEYFEYKLRLCTDSFITTLPDEASIRNMAGPESLLAIFTATGQYRSFQEIVLYAKSRGTDVVIISEEFNVLLMENCDRYVVLSHHNQSGNLQPYEKTRTVFFIFIEQVVQKLLKDRNEREDPLGTSKKPDAPR